MTNKKREILKQVGIVAVELLIIALYVVFSFCVLWNYNPLESNPEEKAKGEYCASPVARSLASTVGETQQVREVSPVNTEVTVPFMLHEEGIVTTTTSGTYAYALVYKSQDLVVGARYTFELNNRIDGKPWRLMVIFNDNYNIGGVDSVNPHFTFTGRAGSVAFYAWREGMQHNTQYEVDLDIGVYQGEYSPGFLQGYNLGLESGKTEGYQNGYSQGVQDATDEFTLLSEFIPANLSFPFADSVSGSISLDSELPGRPLSAKWIYKAGVAPGSYQSSLAFSLNSPMVSNNLYRLEYSSTQPLLLASGVGFPDRAISSTIANLPAGKNVFVTFYAPKYSDGVDLVQAFSSLYFVPTLRESVTLYDVKLYIVSETGSAYDKGYSDGQKVGFAEGDKASFQRGYSAGYSEAIALAGKGDFFSLISAVVDAPVTAFVSLLNFEILGFNMLSFVVSILVAGLCVACLRLFAGGKP